LPQTKRNVQEKGSGSCGVARARVLISKKGLRGKALRAAVGTIKPVTSRNIVNETGKPARICALHWETKKDRDKEVKPPRTREHNCFRGQERRRGAGEGREKALLRSTKR